MLILIFYYVLSTADVKHLSLGTSNIPLCTQNVFYFFDYTT